MRRFITHHSAFIICLALALAALGPASSLALAANGSFTVTIQSDGYFGKTNTTTWSGTRGAATSNASNTTADTLMAAAGFSTPNYLVHRIRLVTEAINADQSTYDDSLALANVQNFQLDSVVLSTNFFRITDNSGCSGYLFAGVFDTCLAVTNSKNYQPAGFTTLGWFNDPFTADLASYNSIYWFDSVATTNGQAEGRSTFAITDRTVLDEIECLMRFNNSGTVAALRFDIVVCYDYSNSDPGTANVYQYKAAISSLEAAAAKRPTLTCYWSDGGTLDWFQTNPFSQLPFSQRPHQQ